MRAVGRVSSAIVVFSVASMAVVAGVWPHLMHVGPIHVVDWIGLMIYVAAPVDCFSAMLQWAKHFPSGKGKTLWGAAVVLGVVPGAIVYWLWGFNRVIASPNAEPTHAT